MAVLNHMFPFQGWVLSPSFNPMEITLTHRSSYNPAYLYAGVKGRAHLETKIHATKAAAVVWGVEEVSRLQAMIDSRQAGLNKRLSNLKKAAL